MKKQSKVLGIYSKNYSEHTGSGYTLQKQSAKTFYYVLCQKEVNYIVQPLDKNSIPSGLFSSMSRDKFIASFKPEIDYYSNHPLPELEVLKGIVADGISRFRFQDFHIKIQALIESLLRTPGGSGLSKDQKTNFNKISEVVAVLSQENEEVRERQRQEFNSAGISLRKQQLYDEALNFYTTAIKLNSEDENLHFNIARAYFEKGEIDFALDHLNKSLQLDPEMDSSLKFKKYIQKRLAPAVGMD